MATLNKMFCNLVIYLIGPIEDDTQADDEFGHIAKALRTAGVLEVINPCEQELEKTGFLVQDSQTNIMKLRMQGKDAEADKIYKRIWEVDLENVRRADIIVANIPAGTRYVGTTREATMATTILGIDLVRDSFDDEQKKIYEEQVRPGLKKLGFFNKPVYLITPAKTRINGTMIHGLVHPSDGDVFPNSKQLISALKEKYK